MYDKKRLPLRKNLDKNLYILSYKLSVLLLKIIN